MMLEELIEQQEAAQEEVLLHQISESYNKLSLEITRHDMIVHAIDRIKRSRKIP